MSLLKAGFPYVNFEVKLAVMVVDVVPDYIRCDIANRAEEFASAPHTTFPIIISQQLWKCFEEYQ